MKGWQSVRDLLWQQAHRVAEALERVLAMGVRAGSVSLHIVCSAMSSGDHQAGLAEAAGIHKVAAEETPVRATLSVRRERLEDIHAHEHEERTESVLAGSRHSEDRMVVGCTFPNPCRVQSCEIDGFHDSGSGRESGRRQ